MDNETRITVCRQHSGPNGGTPVVTRHSDGRVEVYEAGPKELASIKAMVIAMGIAVTTLATGAWWFLIR